MKRLLASVVIAVPVAWVVTGFTDHSGWSANGIAMCLFSPGIALMLSSHSVLWHADTWTLGELGVTLLAVNVAYYAALCYGVLTIRSAFRNSSVAARNRSELPQRNG
jgi:ABC-type Fe3+ transport system permease subunit